MALNPYLAIFESRLALLRYKMVTYGKAAVFFYLAVICAFLCVSFLLVALYLWLVEFWPPHLAALGVAGVIALVGLVLALIARAMLRRPVIATPPVSPHAAAYGTAPASEVSATDTVDSLLRSAKQHAPGMVITALAAGVVVGLMRKDDD